MKKEFFLLLTLIATIINVVAIPAVVIIENVNVHISWYVILSYIGMAPYAVMYAADEYHKQKCKKK